jgi:Protein of unknown function (DUF2911)
MTTRARRLVPPLLLCGAAALPAQARKSQHASVTQIIGTTEVAVVYNRPSARGRRLFGALVPWGNVWCPGADQATTLTVSTDVRLAGQPLKAGRYSVWAIPDPTEWTLIFSRAADVFHIPYPGAAEDALRIKVKPERGPFFETLAFYFPTVEADRAVLDLHWGETVIPIPVTLH